MSHVKYIMNQQTRTFDLPDIDPDADEQFQKSPQGMAIVTLILGLFSPLALLKPMFWVLPISAAALGAVSLFTLARDPEKFGRKAALLGLVLALFFGAWSSSRYFSRVKWLEGVAREKADIWFELVKEDRLLEAHQLHLRFDRRAPQGTSLVQYYAEGDVMEENPVDFFSGTVLQQLRDAGPDVEIKFKQFEKHQRWGDYDDVVLRYVADYQKDGQPTDLEMLVRLRRFSHPTKKLAGWAVDSVAGPDDPI